MAMSLPLRAAVQFRPPCKACLIFLLLASPLLLPLAGMGDMCNAAWLHDWLQNHGTAAIWVYMGLAAALSVIGMPRQAITALGGLAFGAAWGCLWATLGLLTGCACSFYLARFLAAPAIRKHFGPKLHALDATLAEKPFAATLMLRLCPVGSNALLNLSAGVSRMPAGPFFMATLIGYLPQNCIFALLGSGVSVGSPVICAVSGILFLLAMGLSRRIYLHHRRQAA